MTAVLFRVRDKLSADFYKNLQCRKRGDAVVAMPGRGAWGREDCRNPDWRILIFDDADVTVQEAQTWCMPELQRVGRPSKTLQRNQFRFDLDALAAHDAGLAAYLADDKRERATYDVKMPASRVRASRIEKAPVADPAVMGDDPGVIG